MPSAHRHPAWHGGVLALLAALLFGLSTPLVQRAGAGLGSFTTAALLYLGAALAGTVLRRPVAREAAVRRSDGPRLLWMALSGSVLGPVALAWGLQHTSGASASLMLTLEAVFTALLARLWFGETLGHRVLLALGLMTCGGMLLVLERAPSGGAQALGLLAVLLATAAWGVDNTLSRPLAARDPGQVVMIKSLLGVLATGTLAVLGGDPVPTAPQAAGLVAVGAAGYGLSLRCYLLAQRAFGAARTGSVFACAPFIGAAGAFMLGERGGSGWLWGAALLMAAGLWLHLSENHEHEHEHEPLEHEHAHEHADGHHDHRHDPMPAGPHSHWHQHPPLRHRHPHGPDEHHAHRH